MSNKHVILVTKTGLGTTGAGDDAFGVEMLDKFFHTLESQPVKPYAICFYTDGAKVVREGSPHLMSLRLLEGMGVKLVTCLSCLQYYGLQDQIGVGGTGGMKEIVALLQDADSVVTV